MCIVAHLVSLEYQFSHGRVIALDLVKNFNGNSVYFKVPKVYEVRGMVFDIW